MTDSPKKKPANKQSIYSWAISKEELKNQVDNYDSLPFTETTRGAAIIFFLCILALSIVLSAFGVISLDWGTALEWIIYAVALGGVLSVFRHKA